jgi:hypothetical protein
MQTRAREIESISSIEIFLGAKYVMRVGSTHMATTLTPLSLPWYHELTSTSLVDYLPKHTMSHPRISYPSQYHHSTSAMSHRTQMISQKSNLVSTDTFCKYPGIHCDSVVAGKPAATVIHLLVLRHHHWWCDGHRLWWLQQLLLCCVRCESCTWDAQSVVWTLWSPHHSSLRTHKEMLAVSESPDCWSILPPPSGVDTALCCTVCLSCKCEPSEHVLSQVTFKLQLIP